MDKEKFKQWLQQYYAEQRNIILNDAKPVIIKRDGQEDSSKRIQLRIKLNSESPVYGYGSYKYKEVIDSKAFDDSLKSVEKGDKVIYSFADHQMDTQNIIASTANENTKLFKKGNEIVMEFDVDETNQKAMNIYKLIEEGSIKANSFIFKPSEMSYRDLENDPDGATELVTVKSGDLISVDPVVFAFYPQNEMQARNKDVKTFVEAKETKEKNKHIERNKNMRELLLKMLTEAYKRNKMELPADLETKSDAEILEMSNTVQRQEFETMLDTRLTEQQRAERLTTFEGTVKEMRDLIETKDNEERSKMAKKLKELEAKVSANGNEKESIIKRFIKGMFVDKKEGLTETVRSEISAERAAIVEGFTEIEKGIYLARDAANGVSGSGVDTASQIIPVPMAGKLIEDRPFVLPEVGGEATMIPYAGENTTKVAINIATDGLPTLKTQDEESDAVAINDVAAELTPKLYSEHFVWNPRMMTHVNTIATDTMNLINRAVRAWRKIFAEGLLTHIAATFDSLKGADKNLSTYKGGATIEAVVAATADGALSISDFDLLEDGLRETYGDIINTSFRYYMNVATWGAVKALHRAMPNDYRGFVVNEREMTINGIKVILNSYFNQDIPTAAGSAYPIVLYDTRDVRVYGGMTVIRDSSEAKFLSRKVTRQVNTYGEVKLFDPKYRTRVLKITKSAAPAA